MTKKNNETKRLIAKIALIVLLLLIVSAVLLLFKSNLDASGIKKKKIKAYSFVEHIQQSDSIASQPSLTKALEVYSALYNEIRVEASVTANSSKGPYSLLSDADADKLFSDISSHICSLYISQAESLFNSSVWPKDKMDELDKVGRLLAQGGYNGVASYSRDVNRFLGYVSGYRSALNAVNRAKDCRSSAVYYSIMATVNRYKGKEPYKNNTALNNKLNSAEKTAKRSLMNCVMRMVDAHNNKVKNNIFSDNAAYLQSRRACEDAIWDANTVLQGFDKWDASKMIQSLQ